MANCTWCNKEMDSTALRCPHCGKLRKDIYDDKVKCYFFCILGGLLLGVGVGRNVYLLALGIIVAVVGIYFYFRTSQKMGTYWWI
jgi:hypothetical protein